MKTGIRSCHCEAKKTFWSHLAWHLIVCPHTHHHPWIIGSYRREGSAVTFTGSLWPPQSCRHHNNNYNSDCRHHRHRLLSILLRINIARVYNCSYFISIQIIQCIEPVAPSRRYPFNAHVTSKNFTVRISLKPDLKPLQNVMFLNQIAAMVRRWSSCRNKWLGIR